MSRDPLGPLRSKLSALIIEGDIRRWRSSWAMQRNDERSRRLQYVREMSAELARIEAVSIQATAWGTAAIESVILGERGDLEAYAGYMAFDRGPDAGSLGVDRELADRFSALRNICLSCLATWPNPDTSPKTPS